MDQIEKTGKIKLGFREGSIPFAFVDPKVGLCVGCFRNMEELARWTKYSDAERDSVIIALPGREKTYRNSKNSLLLCRWGQAVFFENVHRHKAEAQS